MPDRPPAATVPEHIKLVRDFVNTVDAEDGTDDLTQPRELTRWLVDHGLLGPGGRATKADVELARELRVGLRRALQANHRRALQANHGHGGAAGSTDLERVSSRLPLRLVLDADGPRLEPVTSGVVGALSHLLVAVNQSAADDTWTRLKLCPAEDCQWAFYDQSKNRSKSWCAMGVCGNRAKTRSYRQRQRATS
jgi:predicted RNA-binding Zn ribbon-like protein